MSVVVERHVSREQFEKVRANLAAKNFKFAGDAGTFDAGTPVGRVAGGFKFDNGVLRVEVTKHPIGFGGFVKDQINKGIDEAS